MNKLIFFSFAFLITLNTPLNAQDNRVRYEVLLNNNMLADSLKKSSLVSCFDVSPESLITLSDGSLVYLLGWGGFTSIGNKSNQNINSFAFSSDGLLFAVIGNDLCHINKDGNWDSLVRLPSSQMSISKGRDVMYIYDHIPGNGKYYAYILAKGGKYRNLFPSPNPINAICEMGDSIYIAIESAIYSYSPQTKKLISVFALEKENKIISLSADPDQLILYFSTLTAIYAFKNSSVVKLSDDFPNSIIKFSGTGLLIFNSFGKDIMHIVNIEESIEF